MSNPIKFSFKTEWFSFCLLITGFIAGLYFYQHFPNQVPTHWDLNGQVNGYSGPFLASFLVPIIMVGVYLMFLFLPYFDPKKEQYINFAGIYHNFKDLIISFLFLIYFLASLNGLGYKINISFYTPLLIGALFIVLGFLLRKVKMNWFLGIKTPWTMSSETVWNKTHKLANWVLVFSGLLMAATVLVPQALKTILFILSIAAIVLILPVYSYVLYAREKKLKK